MVIYCFSVFEMNKLWLRSTENAGCPNGLPNWVIQKNKSSEIIDNVVKVINNKQSKLPKITWAQTSEHREK